MSSVVAYLRLKVPGKMEKSKVFRDDIASNDLWID